MAAVLACRGSDALSGWPAAIAARSSISQSGLIGYTVNDPPSVQLLDGDGHPIVGVPVTFTLTAGGGALSSGVATTGSDGVATVGNWTVTAGTNTVVVSIPAPFRVAPVTFTATGEVQAFNIDLIFLTPAALAQRAVFDSAAGKWQRLIYGDIPNINVSIPAGACLGNEPAVSGQIDDVLIFVTFDSIDGPGKILAGSGPCFIRTADDLPLYGVMVFDTADVALLDSIGALQEVVTHEMAHVLGFGTLWQASLLNLLRNPVASGGTDPSFVGPWGLAAFDALGGGAYTGGARVPVENQGGPGTADGHWRESVFANELMTGYLNPGVVNPLSVLTVASMRDEGYRVNYAAADPYSHPFLVAGIPRATGQTTATLSIGSDILRLPIYLVEPNGRVSGVLRR